MPIGRAILRMLPALAVGLQLAGWSPARASDYNIKSWGVDDGMAQSSVTDIAQTPDGYIWIGTLLSGLSRFDGQRFVNFDTANTPSLPSSGIRRLLVDSEGILWVNDYDNHLFQWQGKEFVSVGAPPVKLGSLLASRPDSKMFVTLDAELLVGKLTAKTNWVWEVIKPALSANPYYLADAEGTLWFRAPGSKLGRVVGHQFEILEHPAGLENRQVLTVAKDSNERLCVGTDEGVFKWNGERFINITPPGETNLAIRQIVVASKDKLWVEVNGKFRLLANGEWKNAAEGWDGQKLPWSRLRLLRSDNQGGIWISLREEGLAHIGADGSMTRLTSADGLPSQLVQAVYVDHGGNLWTGYHRSGLLQIGRRLFHPVAHEQGLLDTVVTSVTEDTQGAIWIGSAGGGVAQWVAGNCTNYTLPQQGAYCQDVVVCGGPDGRVWIGTGGNGLLVAEHGVFRHVIEPASLAAGVRLLCVQKNGRVWFANLSGLFQLQDEKPVRVLEFKSTAQAAAAIAEGQNEELWVGTIGGTLRRFADGQWTDFTPADQAQPSSRFWSLLPDADGSVWIGTLDQGLLRFKDGKFTRFTTADGLADISISQILDDGEGHLWLGSHKGVLCVSKAALVKRAEGEPRQLTCRMFGRGDGLLTTALSLEFQPNCLRAGDGRFWFGTANGVSWLSPENLRQSQAPPSVIIEAVTVDGRDTPISAVSLNATLASASVKPSITVGPGLKNLEINFTAPNFKAPEMIQFKYRLEGLDAEWTPVGNRRVVAYTHLPPGRFNFHVIAGNSDGVWNETGAAFELVITPHFWQRAWFMVTSLIGASGLLAYTVRRITKRRMQRKLDKLERQRELERERSRIAQDLHDDLGAALTEISLTSDFMQKTAHDPEMVRECVREIGSRARELFSAMDEIVWAVNPRNDSTVSLAAYFCQFAQHQLKPAGIACRLDIDSELPSLPLNAEQRHQVFLVFKEAVNNVVRHSQAREMKLSIATNHHDLSIRIEDYGCGFEPARTLEGADGLINMPERMKRIGGFCRVTSELKQGTVVELRVPLSETQ